MYVTTIWGAWFKYSTTFKGNKIFGIDIFERQSSLYQIPGKRSCVWATYFQQNNVLSSKRRMIWVKSNVTSVLTNKQPSEFCMAPALQICLANFPHQELCRITVKQLHVTQPIHRALLTTAEGTTQQMAPTKGRLRQVKAEEVVRFGTVSFVTHDEFTPISTLETIVLMHLLLLCFYLPFLLLQLSVLCLLFICCRTRRLEGIMEFHFISFLGFLALPSQEWGTTM